MGSGTSENHSTPQTKNMKTSIEYPAENFTLSLSVIEDSIFLTNHHDNSRIYIGILGMIVMIVAIDIILTAIIIVGSISTENETNRRHRLPSPSSSRSELILDHNNKIEKNAYNNLFLAISGTTTFTIITIITVITIVIVIRTFLF